jgi:hypothetical protein
MTSLLSGWRQHSAKWLVIFIFFLPALCGALRKSDETTENRNLAAFPAKPHGWAELIKYPGQLDLWINDHMGLRNQLIALNNRIRYRLFRQFPTPQVLNGRGRTVLVSHGPADREYSAVTIPCGWVQRHPSIAREQLNHFVQQLQDHGLTANLLLVPSAPVIYPETLPRFLQKRCQRQPVPLQQIMASPELTPLARAHIEYPLGMLMTAKAKYTIFPDTWFHWGGDGPRLVSELMENRFWPGSTSKPLVSYPVSQPSDIGHLFPGVHLSSMVPSIDFAASGVQPCMNLEPCFPELPDILGHLWATARYRNPHAPLGRLIVISDSFGPGLAPWLSRYYQDVVLIPTNDFPLLNEEKLVRLRKYLFDTSDKRQFLFVYHDGNVHGHRIEADAKLLFP